MFRYSSVLLCPCHPIVSSMVVVIFLILWRRHVTTSCIRRPFPQAHTDRQHLNWSMIIAVTKSFYPKIYWRYTQAKSKMLGVFGVWVNLCSFEERLWCVLILNYPSWNGEEWWFNSDAQLQDVSAFPLLPSELKCLYINRGFERSFAAKLCSYCVPFPSALLNFATLTLIMNLPDLVGTHVQVVFISSIDCTVDLISLCP